MIPSMSEVIINKVQNDDGDDVNEDENVWKNINELAKKSVHHKLTITDYVAWTENK